MNAKKVEISLII